MTKNKKLNWIVLSVVLITLVVVSSKAVAEKMTSYSPVVIKESFDAVMSRMSSAKPAVMKSQMDLLNERYDLSDRPAKGVTMPTGKSVQEGVRAKLSQGVTWEKLEK